MLKSNRGKILISATAFVALASLFWARLPFAANTSIMLDLTETPELTRNISLSIGEKLVVRLKRNSGTPFSWSFSTEGPAIVSAIELNPIKFNSEEKKVGYQELQVFEISADKPGFAEIRFNFSRPRGNPIQAYYLFIQVDP